MASTICSTSRRLLSATDTASKCPSRTATRLHGAHGKICRCDRLALTVPNSFAAPTRLWFFSADVRDDIVQNVQRRTPGYRAGERLHGDNRYLLTRSDQQRLDAIANGTAQQLGLVTKAALPPALAALMLDDGDMTGFTSGISSARRRPCVRAGVLETQIAGRANVSSIGPATSEAEPKDQVAREFRSLIQHHPSH